jgi:hypothetical protein
MLSTPSFSICHATARFPGWEASYSEWFANADKPNDIEYIVGVHALDFDKIRDGEGRWRCISQANRYCSVDNWNVAADASTGRIIILNSDDFFPPKHWDTELLKVVPDLEAEFVIHVSTGSPNDDHFMTIQMMSRTLYARWGYALYPAYESVYCDNDFTEHARQDRVVIAARHLTFEHRHPAFGKAPMDDVYRHENRPQANAIGNSLLDWRRKTRFGE